MQDSPEIQGTQVTIGLYLLSAIAVLCMGWMPGAEEQDLHRFAYSGAPVLLGCAVLAAFGQRNGWLRLIQASILISNLLISVTVGALRLHVGDAYEVEVFYLLPLLIAAHFHSSRFVNASIALCALGHPIALAVAFGADGGPPVDVASEAIARSIPVVAVMSSVAVLVHRMRRRDLTQRELLRSEATTDPLTKLLNRRGLRQAIDAGEASAGSTVVIMADLDHFKAINDTDGHDVGDRVLCEMADALRDLDAANLAVRFGGEEFLVLIPHRDVEAARSMVDAVAATLRQDSPSTMPTTASFGITTWQVDEPFSAAIKRADAAVYEAKRRGRDRAVVRTAPALAVTSAHVD